MSETRKIAAILVADVVGYGRLAGADEEGTLARLRALRSDLIANSDMFRPPIPINSRPPRRGSPRPACGLVDKALRH
jgi:hypothetical protein